MLGRTYLSPGLLAPWLFAALVAISAPVQAQDPFAEPEQEAAAPQVPAAGEEPQDADAAPGDDPFADPSTDADGGDTSLLDEYGFDPAEEFADGDGQELADRDPWEGFNRAVFRFNDTADRWVLKPVATSYRQITPIFMQYGVSNFFGNLGEVTNTFNSVLQWKWGQAGNDSGRFLINSTIGLAGLFDVAKHMGLEPNDGEDFGQTLAVWGVPSGPYLVLPLMGPSTMRDTPASAVDWYTNPVSHIDHHPTRYTFVGVDLVQTRAGLLQAESLIQGDRYVLLRDAYLQRRDYLVGDGEVEDDFGSDFEDDFGSGIEDDSGDESGDPFGEGQGDVFDDNDTGDDSDS